MMVALGLISGLGAGAIDAGLNTYVAAHFSAGLMQWLHSSYGIGITSGPFIMTFAITQVGSWQAGYRTVSLVQFLLAACFILTLPLWTQEDGNVRPASMLDHKTPLGETLRQVRVWLSLLQFFIYTGAEVGLGAWAFTLLTESRGVDPAAAGFWTGSFWALFTIGRLIAGLFARRLGASRLVLAGLTGALLGAGLLWWNPSSFANLLALGVIGFAIAPIYPGLVSGTQDRVGARFAANTVGMQVAAAGLGASVIPAIFGVLARRISLETIPIALGILFLALLFLPLSYSETSSAAA
jgi:fucose permease